MPDSPSLLTLTRELAVLETKVGALEVGQREIRDSVTRLDAKMDTSFALIHDKLNAMGNSQAQQTGGLKLAQVVFITLGAGMLGYLLHLAGR